MNKTHIALIEAFLNYPLDEIKECPSDIATVALDAISSDETYLENKEQLKHHDILSTVDQIRCVLQHPCPQNYSASYPYVGQEAGYCMYAIRECEVKSRKEDAILLKDGRIILRKNIICDKESKNEDGISIIAKEEEGLLSLTSRGQITKEELCEFITTKIKNLKKEILCESKEALQKINDISQNLLQAIVTQNNITQMDSALSSYKMASQKEKQAIDRQIHRIYFSYSTSYEIEEKTYISILENKLLELDKRKKFFEKSKSKLKELSDCLLIEEKKSDAIKKEIIKKYWKNCPHALDKNDIQDQFELLSLSTSNYNSTRFPKWGFKPRKEVIQAITPYTNHQKEIRDIRTNISKIETEIKQSTYLINLEKEKEQKRQKTILWLSFLKQGDFKKADELISSDFNGISIKATDNLSRNALYYAIKHSNFVYAKELYVKYKLDSSVALQVIPHDRSDLKQALESPHTQPLKCDEAWEIVLQTQIILEIEQLISGSKEFTLDDMYKKYKTSHQINIVLNFCLKQLEAVLLLYLDDDRSKDLTFFENAFSALGKQQKFEKILELFHKKNTIVIPDCHYLEEEKKQETNESKTPEIITPKINSHAIPKIKFQNKKNKMQEDIKYIASRWKDSPLTSKKIDILNNFIAFIEKSQNDSLSATEMVAIWAKEYYQNNNENPFITLNTHRRTGYLSIFNPRHTDSIKLFHEFLRDEEITSNINEIMTGGNGVFLTKNP